MALPPPDSFLANFYQPLTLYADEYDKKPPLVHLPVSKGGIFSFLKGSSSLGWQSRSKVKVIGGPKSEKAEPRGITVSLESLEWLEDTCRKATSRSALWAKDKLVDIQIRSEQHNYNRGYSVMRTKDVDALHSRAAAAARTLLALPEEQLPPLPQELVRCIFLWVACQDVTEAKILSLVSTTVQNWVDPCVFKYFSRNNRIEEIRSSRILRAKAHYFTGYNLLSPPIASVCQQLPALRSFSLPIQELVHVTTLAPSIRRLHIDDYTLPRLPLSSNVFSKITHLSLNLKTQGIHVFHSWDWKPLTALVALRCFIFHTHFFPHRIFWPNAVHAKLWIDFVVRILLPCIPASVELVLWVVPELELKKSLEHYRTLSDGTVDRRLVVAFERGNGLGTHATSESAGAGPYAFVYPVLKQRRYAGLDWLEWLWEEALMFLRNREKVSNADVV